MGREFTIAPIANPTETGGWIFGDRATLQDAVDIATHVHGSRSPLRPSEIRRSVRVSAALDELETGDTWQDKQYIYTRVA